MAKKFPKNLYVKIEKDGSTEYFSADEMLWPLVEMGEKVKIATYQLVGVQEAQGVVETKRAKP